MLSDKGVKMETALTDNGCAIVRTFLAALLKAHETPRFKSVAVFLKDYRECVHGYRHRRTVYKKEASNG